MNPCTNMRITIRGRQAGWKKQAQTGVFAPFKRVEEAKEEAVADAAIVADGDDDDGNMGRGHVIMHALLA